jgi:hypothetical protein
MTAAVVMRGFSARRIWHSRGRHQLARRRYRSGQPSAIAVPVVPGVKIERVHGRSLDALLVDGEVDAVIALRPPPSFLAGDRGVVRLFPDWRDAEQDYYARTRFFPIMHTVGVRRALVDSHPWLPGALYRAFCAAKEVAIGELENLQAPKVTLPWAAAELATTRSVMGHDFWPYGLEPNRAAIERMIRYHHDEGLSPRAILDTGAFSSRARGEAMSSVDFPPEFIANIMARRGAAACVRRAHAAPYGTPCDRHAECVAGARGSLGGAVRTRHRAEHQSAGAGTARMRWARRLDPGNERA